MSLDLEGWVKFGKLSAEFLVECVKLTRSNTYEATVIAFILTMCVAVPLGLILYFSLFGSASPQPSTATTSSSTQQQPTTGSSTSAANSAAANTAATPTATAAINTTSNNSSSSLSSMKTTAAWLSKQPRFLRQMVLGIFIVLLFTLGGLLVMIVFSPSSSSAVEVEVSTSAVSNSRSATQELTAMTSGGSPSVVEERRSSSRSSELSCKWTTYDDNSNSKKDHRGGEGGGKEEEEDIRDSDHDSDDDGGEEDSSSRRMGRRRKGGLRHHRHKEAWNDKFGYFPFMYPPPQSTPPTSSSAHDNDEGLDDEDDSLAHSLKKGSSTTTVAHSPCRKPRYLYGFSLLTSATPIHVSKKSTVVREMGRSVDNDYFNVLYRSNADQVCRKRSLRGSGSTARHNHRDEKQSGGAEEEDDESIIDDDVVEEEEEMDDDCFADYTSLYSLNSNGNLNFGWSEFTSNYAGSKRQSKIREGGRRRIFSSSHAPLILPRRRRDKYVYLIPIGTCSSSEAAVNITLVTEKVATLTKSFPGEDEESSPDPLEMVDEDHDDNELDDDDYRRPSPLHLMNHGGDVLRAARRSQRLEYSSELHGLRFSTLLRQRRENYLLKKHYSKSNQTTSGGQEEGEDDNTKKKQDRTSSKEVDQDSGNDERNVNNKNNSKNKNKRPEVKSDKRRYLVVESMAERLIKRHKAEQRRNRLFEEGGGVQGMEPPPLPVLPEPILFDSVILYRTYHEHERDHHSLMRRSHFNKGHVTQNLNEGRAKEKSSVRTRIGALFDNEIPQDHQERRGETGGSSFSQLGNSVDDEKELISLRSSHREISRLQDGARNSALYLAWDTELPPTVGATSPSRGGRSSSSKLSKKTSKKKIQK